jgi:hypothetical protein
MATPKAASKKPAEKKPAVKPAKKSAAAEGTSKFAEFLKSKKLDTRRLLGASRSLEALTREDRTIRHNKRVAKAGEGGDDKAVKETRKARSGRPITPRSLKAALTGGPLSGPVKTRILRAVNHLLEQKKSEKVDLKALF